MAAVFHGYCKFLQQKTHGMSKQLPNKSNKTQWVCPKMGYAQHHISPSFRKKVCPILRHARVFCRLFSTSLRSRMVEEVCRQNGAVRTRNAERNSQKTYIASAGSTSAKRSWGPCWKFDIALGCLKLQETEFYLCFTGIRSVHDPVISWHSSSPCKIWGSNGRLDWKQWR